MTKKKRKKDFPGSPGIKTLSSTPTKIINLKKKIALAIQGATGSISGQERSHIPHGMSQEGKKKKKIELSLRSTTALIKSQGKREAKRKEFNMETS